MLRPSLPYEDLWQWGRGTRLVWWQGWHQSYVACIRDAGSTLN